MATNFKRVRDIIADYKANKQPNIIRQMSTCTTMDDYVYGDHQNRRKGQYSSVSTALGLLKILQWRFTNFEHLYDVVRAIFMTSGHASAYLSIYDTALRIGYNHAEPILPSKYVYLYKSVGTSPSPRQGAINLYGQPWVDKYMDKDYRQRIKTRWFSKKFPNMESWEIESILCIYAKYFYLNMPY